VSVTAHGASDFGTVVPWKSAAAARTAGTLMPVTMSGMRVGMTRRLPESLRALAFRRFWTAATISYLGDQVTSVALPLVATLALHVGAAQMGILTALEWLPALLFSLHAGAFVDRRGRRRATMIATDCGRALLLASIPVAYWLDALSLPWL